ncbi:MAG: glycosyltransferase, partial [Candidatus Omnitrophota bacterium]|nr:glycosyltransferase [Candidatus Omnitrophota bacterium]
RLKRVIEALKLGSKVSLIPSAPNKDIDKYYKEADIFVSVNDYGGVSKVVIEAMASGLPVIVNRPRWEFSPELLGDTDIIADNSVDGFVKALNRMIANPDLMAAVGNRNREKALEIDGRIMEQKEMELYKGLLCKA